MKRIFENNICRALAFVSCASCLCVGLSASGQTLTPRVPEPITVPSLNWTNAANRWQLATVKDVDQSDTVNPTIRALRSEAWSQILAGPLFLGRGTIDVDYSSPDLTNDASSRKLIWVVGTFTSFHVYALSSESNKTYTEMNYKIESIIRNGSQLSLQVGSQIDVGIAGGRLLTSDDVLHSPPLFPEKYFPEVGKTYLLGLEPKSTGDFRIAQEWKITNDILDVSSRGDEVKIERMHSDFVGKTLEEAATYIKKTLGN